MAEEGRSTLAQVIPARALALSQVSMAGGMVIASHDAIQPWVGNKAIFDDLSGVVTIANQYNSTKEPFSRAKQAYWK